MAVDLQTITLTDIIVAIFLAGFGYGKVRAMVKRNGNGRGPWGEVATALQNVVDAMVILKGADVTILQEIRDQNEAAETSRRESRTKIDGQGRAIESIKTTVVAIQGQINTLNSKQ